MISENSTPTTEAAAFSVFAFFGNIGIFAGTLLGGLAKPAEQFKGIFGHIDFFKHHPYALPTMAAGFFVLCTLFVAIFLVEEVCALQK
jgi:hypothetical protein